MAMLDLESPPSGGPWTFGVAALDGGAALGVAALVGLRRELKINLCPGQGHSLSATRRERWEAGGMQEEAGRRRVAAEEACLSSHVLDDIEVACGACGGVTVMAPPFKLRRATLDGELSELARGAVGCARQLLQAISHLTLLAAQLLEHVLRQLLILLPLLVEHLELRGLGALLDVLSAQQRRRRGGVVRQSLPSAKWRWRWRSSCEAL